MNVVRAFVVGGLLLLAGCGGGEAPPHVDLAYSLQADETEVEPGRGFGFTVVRGWSKALMPEAFEVRAVAPLTLHPLGVDRREDETHVQETLHYRAHAFTLRKVVLAGLVLQAAPRGGGAIHEVVAEPLEIVVRPVLPEDGGPPELPGAPLADPPSRGPILAAVALLLVLGAVAFRRFSRRSTAPRPAPSGPGDVALAALERIRARASTEPPAIAADIAGAAEVLRVYVASRHAFAAPCRTTEEVAFAAERGLLPEGAALLDVLRAADRVKFAALAPTSAARAVALDRAVDYVRATAAEGAPS